MSIISWNEPYIPKDRYDIIRNYKFRGADNSLLYTLFTSNLAQKTVEHIPEWIA